MSTIQRIALAVALKPYRIGLVIENGVSRRGFCN